MSGRVMIHVQHLLGVGHLSRAAQLANALDRAGKDVALVSGGRPAPQIVTRPGVRRMQLPSLRAADVSFSSLVDADGQAIDDNFRRDRCNRLLNLYEDIRPEVLVTELFPFGRRQLRFELLPLLELARRDRHCHTIACSVRDIVNQRPHRQGEMLEWLNRYYRCVVVHGDQDFIPFADSAPFMDHFRGDLFHTGYLTNAIASCGTGNDEPQEVLVSAGGGAVGAALFEAAAAARNTTQLAHLPWRFRHGRDEPGANLDRWRELAGAGAIFEPVAPDFTNRLAAARLAICQIGYNTAAELLATGTPAVLVPFAGGSETEQTRRADSFARLGYPIVPEDRLSPESLSRAVDLGAALAQPVKHRVTLDDGRQATSRILRGVAP
ncbi:MAG: glycosyltransferase [Minwuia sp.]|nr:glycosyltransferase [Minwuia sp.]